MNTQLSVVPIIVFVLLRPSRSCRVVTHTMSLPFFSVFLITRAKQVVYYMITFRKMVVCLIMDNIIMDNFSLSNG